MLRSRQPLDADQRLKARDVGYVHAGGYLHPSVSMKDGSSVEAAGILLRSLSPSDLEDLALVELIVTRVLEHLDEVARRGNS